MDNNGNPDNLTDFFKLSIFASGTPAAYQKSISKDREWKANTCSCSPSDAISGKMIRRPELNLIKGSMDSDFPAAIKAVLKREIETCSSEPFLPRILVNCNGRDQIGEIIRHEFIAGGLAEKKFHIITIHSPKDYDDDNQIATLKSVIDGKEVDSQEAYDAIEKLDDGYFGDDLPVFVFQVGMIGEGINVKCFNSTIVTTHSDKTAMQQIGRVVRNYKISEEGPDKIEAGHAAVYAFVENLADLRRLVLNLLEYDLTSDCYDWGKEIDVSRSSSKAVGDSDEYAELNGFRWNDVEVEIVNMIVADVDAKAQKKSTSAIADFLVEQTDIVSEFMEALKNDPEYFKEFGINSSAVSKFSKEGLKRDKTSRLSANADIKEERPAEAGKAKREKKENTVEMTADFIRSQLTDIMLFLDGHPDARDEIWPYDRSSILDELFMNKTVARFFDKHIGDDLAALLAGKKRSQAKAKPEPEMAYNNDIKENNECQEISEPKSTVAAQGQAPTATSGSSTGTSGQTGQSGVWRWLTSLLRR